MSRGTSSSCSPDHQPPPSASAPSCATVYPAQAERAVQRPTGDRTRRDRGRERERRGGGGGGGGVFGRGRGLGVWSTSKICYFTSILCIFSLKRDSPLRCD